MKVLHSWLQDFIEEKLPSADEIAAKITMHAFEIEGVDTLSDGDAIIDVDVLPNRSHDCLGHYGLAREVATLFDLTFRIPPSTYETDASVSTKDRITLSVEKPALVPRATKRLLSDVSIGPSPELIKTRLEKLGQRSINNIVDITNYVMLETGQPVHAFDFDKVSKGKETKTITIRGAKEGEKVSTLDGKEFTLAEGMLVISDEDRALDIAGVRGGADSGIDENTKHIILSACNFNGVTIRKTSRKLGLLTDASKRFEQGITPELIDSAVERASELFAQYAGAHVATDILDAYPRKRNPYMLGVSVSEANAILGTTLSSGDIEKILGQLQFDFKKINPIPALIENAKSLVGTKYLYGASISYDAPNGFDCASFVSYLYSHVGLPIPRMAVDQYTFGDSVELSDLKPGDVVFSSRNQDGVVEHIKSLGIDKVRQSKTSQEFLPGIVYPESIDHNGIYLGDGNIIHASAMWHKGEVIIEKLAESEAFKKVEGYRRYLPEGEGRFVITVPDERLDLRLIEDLVEEIGRVYGYNNIPAQKLSSGVSSIPNKTFYYINKLRDVLVENGYSELYLYSFAEKGDVEVQNPPADDKKFVRTVLATGLTKALEQGTYYKDYLGLSAVKIFEVGTVFPKEGEHFSLCIAVGGVANKLRDTELKNIAEKLSGILGVDVSEDIKDGMLEINITKHIESLPDVSAHEDLVVIDTKGFRFKPFSQYPFVLRDVALWTPEGVTSSEVEKLIGENAGELLVRTTLFDEYKKDDKVSYAFHLVFQSMEKTLADTDVEGPMKKLTDIFTEKGWTVR